MSGFCTQCGSPLRADDRFCADCGTPAAPTAADQTRSLRTLVIVGAAVLLVLVTAAGTAVYRQSRSTSTGAASPTRSPSAADTTTDGTRPGTSVPPPSTGPGSVPAVPVTTIAAPAVDPVAAFKSSRMTLEGGVTIQLADGQGEGDTPGAHLNAAVAFAVAGQRWPALGVVGVNAGAGPRNMFIATMSTAGTLEVRKAIGDRLVIQNVSEVDAGIAVDYLDRRPDQAMSEAPTVPTRVVLDTTTNQLVGPVLSGPIPTGPTLSYRMTEGAHTRSGPSTRSTITGDVSTGQYVDVQCQTLGELAGAAPQSDGGSNVWDRLSNGSYVADYFVDSPKEWSTNEGLSIPLPSSQIPRC